jgi:DNA-binding NarL/FixJ family response regulator
MSERPIKVLVVDDHQLMIDGLKALLEDEDTIEFAGGANSLQQSIDFVRNYPVDVVLMDVNMPGGSGIEATQKIKQISPSTKVLALTMHNDISVITRMIEAGASGYILKLTRMNEVMEAIRLVHKDERYMDPDALKIIMDNLSSSHLAPLQTEEPKPILSSREAEVLKLVACELSTPQIAEKLFISERTVEAHRRNIMIKTKTKTTVGLVKYAMEKGILKSE